MPNTSVTIRSKNKGRKKMDGHISWEKTAYDAPLLGDSQALRQTKCLRISTVKKESY